MKITIKKWNEVPEDKIKKLFMENPYPFYRGTPLANDLMKEYMFLSAKKSALTNVALVVLLDGEPVITGQYYNIPYLSKYWDADIGAIGHIISKKMPANISINAANLLTLYLSYLISNAKFVSITIPGSNIHLIRSFEQSGFVYAEGFINMVKSTNDFRDEFSVPGLVVRDPIESDFDEIDDAFSKMPFPARFVSDGGFDSDKAVKLYTHRFREVHDQCLGKIFIAEIENRFAGALIGIIDEDMFKETGIKTNILSGMGIIIHPRAVRSGVSMHLIESRQDWYKSKGVEYVNFGANFNNRPMLLGLDKLGFNYGSLDVALHKWI